MIEIEKNIPIPKGGGRGKCKYPWKDMQIGDSFLLKEYPKNKKGYATNITAKPSKVYGMKFIQRVTDEGLRIWRVE